MCSFFCAFFPLTAGGAVLLVQWILVIRQGRLPSVVSQITYADLYEKLLGILPIDIDPRSEHTTTRFQKVNLKLLISE